MSTAAAKPEAPPAAPAADGGAPPPPAEAPAPPAAAPGPGGAPSGGGSGGGAPAPSSSSGGGAPMGGGGAGGGAGGAGQFQSASLYIGDLLPEVNEGLLFEIFNAVGPVASIRVCRDAVTRRSLGYAYVNYHQASDAERALDSMNFTEVKGKPCRIMWSQRDPSVRRSGVGNIFVKNLHEGIDNKQLYDTFSLFGNILSCKVVTDKETGRSKGYGYVHYELGESARSAIEKLDGMLIDGREVQVGAFVRRDGRPDAQAYTNVFVKNVPFEWDETKLEQEFAKFGAIVSVSLGMGRRKPRPQRKPKSPVKKEEDEKKEDEKKVEGEEQGEKKEEGSEEKPTEEDAKEDEPKKEEEAEEAAKEKEEPEKAEEEPAKEAPAPSNGNSKEPQSLGFGFVNFADHESAAAAVKEMNDKEYTVVEDGEEFTKVLYVGRAQKKSEREKELRAKYETEKMDRIAKFQGVNLYVKNLDDSVTDDVLRDEFSGMGTITSARVMRDLKTGASRGFGFVCFSTPEDSTRAVNEMNGRIVAGKPIFVALAQRREVRRAQLEAQHTQGRGGGPGGAPGGPGGPGGMMRGQMGGPMGGYPGGPGAVAPMYMPHRPGGPGMQPAYPVVPPMMGGRGGYGAPGVRGGPGGPGGYPGMPGYGMMPAQPGRGGRGGGPMGRGGRGGPGGVPGRGIPGPSGRGRGGPGAGGPPMKFTQQARNAGAPGGPGMAPPGPGGPPPAPLPRPALRPREEREARRPRSSPSSPPRRSRRPPPRSRRT